MDWEIILHMYRFVQYSNYIRSVTTFQTWNNLSYRLTRRFHAPWITQGRVQSTRHGQLETWTLSSFFREKSWIWILHFRWENGALCPKNIYSRAEEKREERLETWVYSLPFGQTAQAAQNQHRISTEPAAPDALQANAPFSSSHFPTDAGDEPQFSPDLESPWSRATFTALCSSLCCKNRPEPMSVLKLQDVCFEDTISACSTGLHASNSSDS